MQGIAKYASRCSWVFHVNVPTRSPDSTPRRRSAADSRSTRSATSRERGAAAAVALEGDDLAVAVDRAPVAEDHPDGEREVLHRRQHRDLRASPGVRDSNGLGSVPGPAFVRHPPSSTGRPHGPGSPAVVHAGVLHPQDGRVLVGFWNPASTISPRNSVCSPSSTGLAHLAVDDRRPPGRGSARR